MSTIITEAANAARNGTDRGREELHHVEALKSGVDPR